MTLRIQNECAPTHTESTRTLDPTVQHPLHRSVSASSSNTNDTQNSVFRDSPGATPPSVQARRRRPAHINEESGDRDTSGRSGGLRNVGSYQETDGDDKGDSNKGHAGPFQGSALQRLESWFGISPEPPLDTFSGMPKYTAKPGVPSGSAPRSSSPGTTSTSVAGTRLVLLHPVTKDDTLPSLALRYGTDVPTLRKANGLWPADSVHARRTLYIPLDRCSRPPSDLRVDVNGELSTKDGVSVRQWSQMSASHYGDFLGSGFENTSGNTSLSPTSHSTTQGPFISSSNTAPSPGYSDNVTSKDAEPDGRSSTASNESVSHNDHTFKTTRIQRVPAETLSYFPPRPRSPRHSELSADKDPSVGAEARLETGRFRLGPGPGMQGFNPGESGVADLLELAQSAKSNGDKDHELERSGLLEAHHSDVPLRHDNTNVQDEGNNSTWKANRWTVGQHRQSPSQNHDRAQVPNEEEPSSHRTFPVKQKYENNESSKGTSVYSGWNDVPDAPLRAYTSGRVAHAYPGSKPQETTTPPSDRRRESTRRTHRSNRPSAFLDDLAAGLPANTGPASNWARPIADSVPQPLNQPASSSQRFVPLGQGYQSSSNSSGGWGKLLSDTIRGRVKLEDALQKGVEELRQAAPASIEAVSSVRTDSATYYSNSLLPTMASGTPPPPRSMRTQRDNQRLSAEMARASLSRNGSSPSPTGNRRTQHRSDYVPAADGMITNEPSRLSGRTRSLHELESLDSSTSSDVPTIQTKPPSSDPYLHSTVSLSESSSAASIPSSPPSSSAQSHLLPQQQSQSHLTYRAPSPSRKSPLRRVDWTQDISTTSSSSSRLGDNNSQNASSTWNDADWSW